MVNRRVQGRHAPKKNYKNSTYVTTRSDHRCKYCWKLIPKGSKVYTGNPKKERAGRYWVCTECDNSLTTIFALRTQLQNVAFGDEGAWLATNNSLAEEADDFLSRCMDNEMTEKVMALLHS